MSELWTAADAGRALRMPTDADDKYSRGVLGLRTGSERYPGAAVLGVEAAWRTGIGMVRYLGAERPATLVLQRRPETVVVEGRVQAWVIGSGTDADDRADVETSALRAMLDGEVPVVVDAGALDLAVGAAAPRILTPHDREHARLRALLGRKDAVDRESAARETAATLGAVVVLKGAETIVATPSGWVARVSAGTPWLATAGTGDVLAGAIGAVVAGAGEPFADSEHLGRLAATAVWLHGRAGALAAERAGLGAASGRAGVGAAAGSAGVGAAAGSAGVGAAAGSAGVGAAAGSAGVGAAAGSAGMGAASGPITALDVAEALPLAVAEALAGS